MAGFLLELLLAGVLLVVVVLAIVRACERAEARERDRQLGNFKHWQKWYASLPKPDAAKYDDWNHGGAERWQSDTQQHAREHGKEPRLGR